MNCEDKLKLLSKHMNAAKRRIQQGITPRRFAFRCSHCGKNTPLLIDGLLRALAEAGAEKMLEENHE